MPPPSRPGPTHFLCIPLAGAQQLSRNIAAFKADVTNPPAGAPVPAQAVRPPGTLHLTLGVMSLKDEKLTQAVDLLRSLRLKAILDQARDALIAAASPAARDMGLPLPSPDQRLSVTLRGLQTMQTPAKASVVYAPPLDPTGLLRGFCERLRGLFQQAGFMAEDERPLLLHATVVNTVYVRGGRGNGRQRMTLDARELVARYGDHVWLENMPVSKVALCRMGAKKVEGSSDGDEAYEVEAEVGFWG